MLVAFFVVTAVINVSMIVADAIDARRYTVDLLGCCMGVVVRGILQVVESGGANIL